MIKNRILITGANGFVGRSLCVLAVAQGMEVIGATRTACSLPEGVKNVVVGNIDDNTDWQNALKDCNIVIHLAARVHVMREKTIDPLTEFRRINTAGTEQLARSASVHSVKRLVYVSTIGVNGLYTNSDTKFTEYDIPCPHNAYATSKWEAELVLHKIQQETGLEIVVVRPPLVYGADAPGNFAQLIKVIMRGVPLPLGLVRNSRDFIYVGNLIDALLVCATHAAAVGETYLLSDGESISTPDLIRILADAAGVPARVFSFPPTLLNLAGMLTGKSMQMERLIGSLQINSNKIRRELKWTPPFSLRQGLEATAANKN
jgi:nucleoside-diphosphate-sugar epimerase